MGVQTMFRYPVLTRLLLSCLILPMAVVANDAVDPTMAVVANDAVDPNKKENAAKPEPAVTKDAVDPNKKENTAKPEPAGVIGACVGRSTDCPDSSNVKARADVRLGQPITVWVENLDELRNRQSAHCKDAKDASCQIKKIHLFLNMMEFKGVSPLFVPGKNALEFRLPHRDELPEYRENKGQKAIWTALFGFGDNWESKETIGVSVGLEDGSSLPSKAELTLMRWSGNGLVFYGVMSFPRKIVFQG